MKRPVLPPRERRPSRGALLGWSAFLWAPALVIAGILLAMTLSAQSAVSAYRDQEGDRGARTFAWLDQWAPMEEWKAPFNEGTARVAAGDPRLALYSFDRALRLVPDEARCDVQTNRAVALSGNGDAAMAEAAQYVEWITELSRLRGAGEALPEDPEWGNRTLGELVDAGQRLTEQAQSDYLSAADALLDPTCEDQRSDEEQQQAEEQAEELQERAGEAGEMGEEMNPNPNPDSEGDGESGQTPEQQEQDRQQELQERNQGEGGGGSEDEGEDEGSGGGVDRPW